MFLQLLQDPRIPFFFVILREMEKGLILYFLVCCATMASVRAADWRVQRLNQFQQKFNNSRSDMIFLIDVSGSVSDSGFSTEKEFVTSLLSKVSVQAIATRVSVITFGYRVERNIDYVNYLSTNRHRANINKCSFIKEFARVSHRKGGLTNMNGAFKKAREILKGASSNGIKRNNVNTVIVLLTDGHWNQGGDPAPVAAELRDRTKYDVEIFSVGIGWHLANTLKRVSGNVQNVITAKNFADFGGLATRIRGGLSTFIFFFIFFAF